MAMSGKAVTFSVSPTSLGYFTPTTDTSDANGLVASVFTAASSGNATLTATVGGNSLSKTLRINESAVSTGRVSIVLNPALMTANGADSARVTISAVNNDNTPVADGTIIYLVAGERFIDRDQDGYFSNGIDSLLFDGNANTVWDPIGSIPSTVTTAGGQAVVTYYAGSQATTVYIRATLVAGNEYDYTEISAKLNPNTTVASITLTHNGEDLRVKGVGGIEFSLVTATAYDEFGNTVPEGIPVDFTIANGPNGGENIQSQGYGPVAVNTNSQGKATVTVYSGTIAGTIRLRASSGTVLSAVTHLTVNAGPPAHISVGVANLNIRAWDVVNAPIISAPTSAISGATRFLTQPPSTSAPKKASCRLRLSPVRPGPMVLPRSTGIPVIRATTVSSGSMFLPRAAQWPTPAHSSRLVRRTTWISLPTRARLLPTVKTKHQS